MFPVNALDETRSKKPIGNGNVVYLKADFDDMSFPLKSAKSEASLSCGQSRGSTEERVNDTDGLMYYSAPWTETQIYRLNKPTDAKVKVFIVRLDSDWSIAPFIYSRLITVATLCN